MDRSFAITLDIEWACDEVLDDVLDLFAQFDVPLTLFCTHLINHRRHEVGLHPNFLRNGTDFREIAAEWPKERLLSEPVGVEREILGRYKRLFPDAMGIRTHSLTISSRYAALFVESKIQYDSSYYFPLHSSKPFRWVHGLWEIPIFYMDHGDLLDPYSGFQLASLPVDTPDLKVFDFHPTLIYINAPSAEYYENLKPHYHDFEMLRRHIFQGRGVKTLLVDLLEHVSKKRVPLVTLAEYLTQVRNGGRS